MARTSTQPPSQPGSKPQASGAGQRPPLPPSAVDHVYVEKGLGGGVSKKPVKRS